MLDIIIHDAFLITMEGPGVGVIENGAVGIRGNRIEVVGKSDEVMRSHKAHRYMNADRKAVLPGLIDAHIHTSIGLLRGCAQDIDNWMVDGLWPFETKLRLDAEASRVGSMLTIMEAVKAGTTTFCDFDSPMDEIVQCHIRMGTRARVAELISGLPKDNKEVCADEPFILDRAIEDVKLQRNIRLIEQWNGAADGRISCLLGPQAPDMVTRELLLEVKELSRRYGTGIHMHVSQSEHENAQTLALYGKRAIPYLHDLGYLDPSLIAVHLVNATEEEVALLAQSGAGMVACNSGSAMLGGMIPPSHEFLQHSHRLAIGSDEAPGNNCCNMFNEMKFTSLIHKCRFQSYTAFPAWRVLRMATVDGAKAIGLGDEIGSLRPGKKADLIIVDLTQPTMQPVITFPLRNVVPNLVFSARGNEVETVIVDGRIVVENFQLKTVNEAELLKDVERKSREIALAAAPEFAQRKTGLYKMMEQNQL